MSGISCKTAIYRNEFAISDSRGQYEVVKSRLIYLLLNGNSRFFFGFSWFTKLFYLNYNSLKTCNRRFSIIRHFQDHMNCLS